MRRLVGPNPALPPIYALLPSPEQTPSALLRIGRHSSRCHCPEKISQLIFELTRNVIITASRVRQLVQQSPGKQPYRSQLVTAYDNARCPWIPQTRSIHAAQEIRPHRLADTDSFNVLGKAADNSRNCSRFGEDFAFRLCHSVNGNPIELKTTIPLCLIHRDVAYQGTIHVLCASDVGVNIVWNSNDPQRPGRPRNAPADSPYPSVQS